MKDVHDSAARGFAAQAGTYARGRPEYPDAIVGWLSTALGLGPGRRAVDLGAGTGKFTRRLLETGAEVVAVETHYNRLQPFLWTLVLAIGRADTPMMSRTTPPTPVLAPPKGSSAEG